MNSHIIFLTKNTEKDKNGRLFVFQKYKNEPERLNSGSFLYVIKTTVSP